MSAMEWKEILQKRIKAKRQILFSKDDPEILSLHLLIGQQPRKAVILWALDLAEETVRELAKTDCAVIYLTETLAKGMEDVLSRYKDELRPAIILIPGRNGSLGIGKANIQRAIERAVGADIL